MRVDLGDGFIAQTAIQIRLQSAYFPERTQTYSRCINRAAP
ncbi:MAG TPA: hypothetical protein VIU81_09365 [Gaiellaceae bacterium]